MFKFCSFVEEYIAPGHTTNWQCNTNEFFLLETSEETLIETVKRTGYTTLPANKMMIGRRFRVYNRYDYTIHLKAVKLHIEDWNACSIDPLKYAGLPYDTVIKQTFKLLTQEENLLSLARDVEIKINNWFRLLTVNNVKFGIPQLIGQIDTRLIIVNRHIRTYYKTPLTLQDLSDLIECNPVYLSNTYSKVFGISPIKHLQLIKMNKAKEWLINTSWSVKTIANNLGYISDSQFSNLFKRHHGQTPLQFKRNQKNSKRVKTTKEIEIIVIDHLASLLQHPADLLTCDDLQTLGLDSLKTVILIVQLEESFSILYDGSELLYENFSSVKKIVKRIENRMVLSNHGS